MLEHAGRTRSGEASRCMAKWAGLEHRTERGRPPLRPLQQATDGRAGILEPPQPPVAFVAAVQHQPSLLFRGRLCRRRDTRTSDRGTDEKADLLTGFTERLMRP